MQAAYRWTAAAALAVRDALSFGEGLSCGRSRSATNGQLRAGTDQGNPRAAHLRHSRSGRHIGRLAIASAAPLTTLPGDEEQIPTDAPRLRIRNFGKRIGMY